MRRFTADYLERTRRGMWESREALAPLDLDGRRRVLDVGCGTGELTRVLAEEAPEAAVVGVDADADLLAAARDAGDETTLDGRVDHDVDYCTGDATRLPFSDDAFDLVVCQALLINLPEPAAAVREFARVSSELVAAVEPDNADVEVTSTVESEASLEASVREAYIAGVETDVAMGDRVREVFAEADLSEIDSRRYRHEKRVEPPYTEADLTDITRKASGAGLADHETELRRALDDDGENGTDRGNENGDEDRGGDGYDALRSAWREMGREAARQAQNREYERVETVPFDVTVGRV
ncbi:methyltransferase domain-containing protein [Halobaculum sp. WSA2]|uniref:Methyltransferase domain-containing protein n=1 Tax=Halobaculum saliterrae TaxID=2073113 RepID=A0A6B0T2R8_9EURY|nr:class I SAM-dependent methyltransferase [Halobaculum saliterrae]MXR42590.1 methyltransferase domain-containing protein [Halobaculum saliterrae]